MSAPSDRRVPVSVFVGIAVLSASLLAFQVLLTRVCALRLHFHFSFLVISNSLLGIGASGTLLTLLEAKWRQRPAPWIFGATAAYVLSLLATWWFAISMPVPETLSFGTSPEERSEFLRFAVFNLGIAVPFLFGGAAVGLILSVYAHRVHAVYASDLLGAGVGCLLCPLLLWHVGAGGCLLAVVILGLGALAALVPQRLRRPVLAAAVGLGAVCLALLPFFDGMFPVQGKNWLKLTQHKQLDLRVPHDYSRWSSNSRIDVITNQQPVWINFCLGGDDSRLALDPARRQEFGGQKWIMQDGDAGTFVSDLTHSELARQVIARSLYSVTANLKQGSAPRVFVIGVGGGNDVWAHRLAGASRIKGVELNAGVLEVHRTVAREFSRDLLDDPRIELVCDEGRSALMRESERYDVVQMTGIDTWTSLASGAYVLAENYLYTVEALQQMYDRLADGGVLQIIRMGADMERLRMLVNVHEAFARLGVGDFADSVAVVSAPFDGLTAVLVKKGRFAPQEVDRIEAFVDANGHLKSYLPGRELPGDNLVQRFVRTADKAAFIRDFPRLITPTTDNQPYFFNFTRWDTPPAAARELLTEATSVSQGNPLFIWGQLAFSTVVAVLLIVVPLLFRGSRQRGAHTGRFLVYFAGIGVGFIFLEIALLQQLTLLLGQPLYSIVVTLFSILIFTGAGSLLSLRWLAGGVLRARAIPLGIALLVVAIVLCGRSYVDAFIGQDLPVRALAAGLMIAPVALLLGMPFAHGIRLVDRTSPHFVPWAWAVNGCATVVGSVATVIVSMNFGFHAVMLAAAAIYGVAFLAVDRLAR